MRRMKSGVLVVWMMIGALLWSPTAQAAPTCFGKPATIVGTNEDDALIGTPRDDVIVGLRGADVINGRGGSDRICAGVGKDDLFGGPGNDKLDSGRNDEAARQTEVFGGSGDDFLRAPTNADGQVMYGGRGDDVIRAGDGNNIFQDALFGGPGNDVLKHGAGVSTLVPGPGDDEVEGGLHGFGGFVSDNPNDDILDLRTAPGPVMVDLEEGTARGEGFDEVQDVESIIGTPFDDVIAGSAGTERLHGQEGDDVLSGGVGGDCLVGDAVQFFTAREGDFGPTKTCGDLDPRGEPGDDILIGDEGDDFLSGLGGNDRYDGGHGDDTAWFGVAAQGIEADLVSGTAMGEGSDQLAGIENLTGSLFADLLSGDGARNALSGGAGSDVLRGLGGDDFLRSLDQDPDRLDGGEGSDTLSYEGCSRIPQDVEADLQAGSDSRGSTLTGIENLIGCSNGSSTLRGDEGANMLIGTNANDVLDGRGGDDFLAGRGGDDSLDGGPGQDTLDGGGDTRGDTDSCMNGETTLRCE